MRARLGVWSLYHLVKLNIVPVAVIAQVHASKHRSLVWHFPKIGASDNGVLTEGALNIRGILTPV